MTEDKKRTLVFAHRGASTEAPENTMAAFRCAAEAGADAIEMDLRRTSDGRVVVVHDGKVNRTTDGKGRVDSFTEDRIRELDAGSWFSRNFCDERIPTLDEVLEWAAGAGTGLNLELKDREIEEFVVRRILNFEMLDRTLLSSWKPEQLVRTREIDNRVRVAPILFFARQLKGGLLDLKPDYALLWSGPALTRSAVASAFAKNVPVIAWKVNSRPLLERTLSRGVAAVMTDEAAIICGQISSRNN